MQPALIVVLKLQNSNSQNACLILTKHRVTVAQAPRQKRSHLRPRELTAAPDAITGALFSSSTGTPSPKPSDWVLLTAFYSQACAPSPGPKLPHILQERPLSPATIQLPGDHQLCFAGKMRSMGYLHLQR